MLFKSSLDENVDFFNTAYTITAGGDSDCKFTNSGLGNLGNTDSNLGLNQNLLGESENPRYSRSGDVTVSGDSTT